MKIFDPLVASYYKNKYGGGSGGGGGDSTEEWIGDGNTHLWISLQEGRTSPMVGVCPNGTVTVDWGDGSEPDVLTGTSTYTVKWTPNHQYAKAGDYVITLTVDGEMSIACNTNINDYGYILRYVKGANPLNMAYMGMLKRLEIGVTTSISPGSFCNYYALEKVAISDGITKIVNNMFKEDHSLESVSIPDSVTSIISYAFQNCYHLKNINIPDGVTSIENGAFQNCRSLESIAIPAGVTSIGMYLFHCCYKMKFIDFTSHTAVPTLSSTTAFADVPADFEIRVPAALYDEWIAATNWATYAINIVAR